MVDYVNQFVNSLTAVAGQIGTETLRIIPGIIGAIIIVLIGWVLARIVKQIIIKLLQSTKVDQWIDEQNLTAAIGGKEVSSLIGSLAKWYIIGIFLAQAVEWLQLETFKRYLMLLFVSGPNDTSPVFFSLLGGVIVMVAGLLIARYFRNIIDATTFKLKKVVSVIAEAVVIIFAGMLALTLVVGAENAGVVVDTLSLFVKPFIEAFAWVLAIVFGVSILVNSKVELKKVVDELKKSVK